MAPTAQERAAITLNASLYQLVFAVW